MKYRISIILLAIVCSLGVFGQQPEDDSVTDCLVELSEYDSSFHNTMFPKESSFGQQIEKIKEKVQETRQGTFWEYIKNNEDTIILGIISSLIASFIIWCITFIRKWLKKPEERLDDLGTQIDKNKEPSKVQKEIDKLEDDIENNPKITQEKKEEYRQGLLELKERNSKQYFDRGLKSFREEPPNLDAALEDFNSAIEQNSNSLEAYYYRGMVLALKNRNEESLKDFVKVIELNPKYHEAYTRIGELKELMGKQEEAIIYYAKASFFKGILKYELGSYEEAIKDFDEAIGLKLDSAVVYFFRGNSKAKLGRYEESIKDYDEAILLKSDDAGVYFYRGNSKAELGRYEESIKDYDEAIRLKSDYAVAYFNRGNSKANLERYEESIKDYDEAIRMKPDYADAYFYRGNSKANLERYEESIKDYDEAIRMKPDYADVYFNRGTSKAKLGRYEEAIKDYDEAIRLKPDFAEAHFNRGSSKQDLERYEESIKDFDEAIRLKLDYAEAYHARGISKANLGSLSEAIKDCNQVLRLNPDFAIAYLYRGIFKYQLGHYIDAVEDLNQAILFGADDAMTYKYRARCYKFLAEEEKNQKRKAEFIVLAENDEQNAKNLNQKQINKLVNSVSELIDKKEYEYAIGILKQVLEDIPDCAVAFLYRGICKERTNNRWGAIYDYTKAIQYNSTLKDAYLNCGSLQMEVEMYDKALENFTKFIELDPDIAHGYIKRAQCYRLMALNERNPDRKKELIDLAEKDEQKAKSMK